MFLLVLCMLLITQGGSEICPASVVWLRPETRKRRLPKKSCRMASLWEEKGGRTVKGKTRSWWGWRRKTWKTGTSGNNSWTPGRSRDGKWRQTKRREAVRIAMNNYNSITERRTNRHTRAHHACAWEILIRITCQQRELTFYQQVKYFPRFNFSQDNVKLILRIQIFII